MHGSVFIGGRADAAEALAKVGWDAARVAEQWAARVNGETEKDANP